MKIIKLNEVFFDKSFAEFCPKRRKNAGNRAEPISRPYKRGNLGRIPFTSLGKARNITPFFTDVSLARQLL
jgi:hypothetical protein